jgi:hypothetical protein
MASFAHSSILKKLSVVFCAVVVLPRVVDATGVSVEKGTKAVISANFSV